jgi:hypothetical protein
MGWKRKGSNSLEAVVPFLGIFDFSIFVLYTCNKCSYSRVIGNLNKKIGF